MGDRTILNWIYKPTYNCGVTPCARDDLEKPLHGRKRPAVRNGSSPWTGTTCSVSPTKYVLRLSEMSIFLRGISKTLQPHCHLPSSPEPRRAQSSQSTQSEPRCQNWSSSETCAHKWEGWPLGMGRYLCTFGGQGMWMPKLLMSSDQPALPGTPHHSPPCANGTLVHTGLMAGSARLEMVNCMDLHGASYGFPIDPKVWPKSKSLDESWMSLGWLLGAAGTQKIENQGHAFSTEIALAHVHIQISTLDHCLLPGISQLESQARPERYRAIPLLNR